MVPTDEPLAWRKSNCSGNGANCVEVAWRKSSRTSNGANCVEVANIGDAVLARDSKNVTGPVIGFGHGEWSAFLHTIKSGALDLR